MADSVIVTENTVELHYYLNDNSHIVDAFVQNRAQAEFLYMARDLAQVLGVELSIEVFPLKEGGHRQFFIFNSKTVKETVSAGVILMILTTCFSTPISQFTGELIKKKMEDPELVILQKEKLKAEIANLNVGANGTKWACHFLANRWKEIHSTVSWFSWVPFVKTPDFLVILKFQRSNYLNPLICAAFISRKNGEIKELFSR